MRGELALKTLKEQLMKAKNEIEELKTKETIQKVNANVDANNITSTGIWRVSGNGTELNFPVAANGIIEVKGKFGGEPVIEQTYTHYDGQKWHRLFWYNNWLPWVK